MSRKADSFEELESYRVALEVTRMVYEISQKIPTRESETLIQPLLLSSRGIGAHLAEAWAYRIQPEVFLDCLNRADGSIQKTRHWIRCACDCGYVPEELDPLLQEEISRAGRLLGAMIRSYRNFCA